jgi:hypothetical protein
MFNGTLSLSDGFDIKCQTFEKSKASALSMKSSPHRTAINQIEMDRDPNINFCAMEK